jgi:hypothetical protein
MDLDEDDVPAGIRRVLRHPRFQRWADRRGLVIHAAHRRIRFWRLHAEAEETEPWPE